ncbi:hypothetical protein ACMFMG_002790 [Clarireedia jacksonii]
MAVLAIWWTLEAYLVLIAASIPTLKPLLTTKSPKASRLKTTTWTSGQQRSGVIKTTKRGTFFSINEPSSSDDIIAKVPASYSVGTYLLRAIDTKNVQGVRVEGGMIRKQMTTSVTYENAPGLEDGRI